MKGLGKKVLSLFIVLVFAMTSLLSFTSVVSAATFTTEQWKAVEITLTSSNTYTNPYLDVDVSATFTGPNSTVMTMPGFWDGGNTWKIRFAPTLVGSWTYITTCTDTSNTGLHNQTGDITCNSYTGNLNTYKHGWSLKKSTDNRYLTYTDETPFFWLGDTHWMGLSYRERFSASNDARWTSEFKGMVDRRASQGYSVYAMNFFAGSWGDISASGTYNEGGYPWNNTGYANSHSTCLYDYGTVPSGGYTYSSGKALDGNLNTGWIAEDGTFPQWMYMDIGQNRTLSKVDTLFSSIDTWKYRIEGSTDGISYTTLVDRTAGVYGNSFSDLTTATTRYVRLYITGSGASTASVKEFIAYDSNNNLLSNGGKYKNLNPSFWQNCDQRIQYVSDKGLIAALGIDWGRELESANLEDYKRVAKYIVARYGAYPVMWTTAGEYAQGNTDCWGQVASYIRSNDPYSRVTTLHNTQNNYNNYRNETWYDIDLLQGGHNHLIPNSYWLGHYNETPTLPIIEGEFNYENLLGSPSYYTREVAYKSIFNGTCGYNYGAEGLWQATWDPSDTSQVNGSSPIPWYFAIDKEAGAEMTYLEDFFTSIDWSCLSPNATAITWNGAPTGTTQDPCQKTNSDNSIVIAYLPSYSSTYTGTLNGLSTSDTYTAKWFNTRDGTYTDISDNFTPDGSGQWSIPSQPSASFDWALIVQKTTNRVAQPAASPVGGIFTGTQSVSLSCSTPGATIYYTIDGSIPTTSSMLYSSAISISTPTVIKAIAVKSGMSNSFVITQYYKEQAAQPTVSIKGGLFNSEQLVTLSTPESGIQIFYTTDGSTPDINSILYNSPISINRTMTLKAIVKRDGYIDSTVLSESYTIISSDLLSQGKTATSSTENPGCEASKAVDGDLSTYWCATSGAMPQWLKVDLGSSYELTYINQIFYTPNLTWNYKIEGSNDDINYTTLVDRTTTGVTGTDILESVSGTARYIKFTITNSSGAWTTSREFKVYGKQIPGSVLLSQGKTTTSSTENPGCEASKAVDGDLSTYWCSTSGAMPQWLKVDLGSSYDLTYINQIFYTPNLTWNYKIEGSNDDITYTTLVDRTSTGVNGTDIIESVSGYARYIKLTVTNSSTGDWATSREFRVYGEQEKNAYWKLDEGTGTSTADSSGKNNTGTLINGAAWTSSGKSGNAVSFNGVDGYINIPDSSTLKGMSALTVAVWVNLSQLPTQNYVPIGKDMIDYSYRIVIDSAGIGHFVVATTNNSWYSAGTLAGFTTVLSPNTWYHIVGTYDGSNVRVYVNGKLEGTSSQSISGSIYDSSSPVRLGYKSSGIIDYTNGLIDQVRIYNKALSPTEVMSLYYSGQ